MEETRVAQCASCGAEIEFDADLHAKECPFCAAPIVTDTGLTATSSRRRSCRSC